jgi:hypothetical protein
MARSGIDTFGRSEFETALTAAGFPWEYLGIIQGEHCYDVRPLAGSPLALMVRSSIKGDGVSADVAKDSIRPFPVIAADLAARRVTFHGGKLGKYVTRRPGWGERLAQQLRRFEVLLAWCVPCAKCGQLIAPFTTRKEDSPNKGRDFVKCCGCGGGWSWVESEEGEPYTVPADWQKRPAQAQPAPAGKPTPRPCPKCEAPAVLPSIKGPGFHCFRRLNGCGAVLSDADMTPPAGKPTPTARPMSAEALRGEMEVLAGEQANAEGGPVRRVSMAQAQAAQAWHARNPDRENPIHPDDAGRYHPEQRNPTPAPARRVGPTTPATPPREAPAPEVRPAPVPGFTLDAATLRAELLRVLVRLDGANEMNWSDVADDCREELRRALGQ